MTSFGTAELVLGLSNTYTTLPGVSRVVNVPEGASLYVATDGGIITTSRTPGWGSVVQVRMIIDGYPADGLPDYRDVYAMNPSGLTGVLGFWNFGRVVSLTPGPHTIAVQVRTIIGDPARIAGRPGAVTQAQLTVLTLRT